MDARIGLVGTSLFLVLVLSDLGMVTVVTSNSAAATLPARPEAGYRPRIYAQLDSSDFPECGSRPTNPTELLNRFRSCLPAVSFGSSDPSAECCSQVRDYGITCLCSLYTRYRSDIPSGIVSEQNIVNIPRQCGLAISDGYVCDGLSLP